GKPMKPKKQVALKFKTLTLTLALATGINVTNGFATEATDAEKITAAGTALKDFIKDYDAANTPAELGVVGTTAGAVATGKGIYKAAGNVGTDGQKAIAQGKDLTKTRYAELLKEAKAIDIGAPKANAVFDAGVAADDSTENKAKLLNLLLTELGDKNDEIGVEKYLNGVSKLAIDNSGKPEVDDKLKALMVDGIDGDSVSAAANTDELVTNIHNLNHVVEGFYKTLYGKTEADELSWDEAKLDAFMAYAAAYAKLNAEGVDKVDDEKYTDAPTEKASALYKELFLAFDTNTAAQLDIDEKIKTITKDTQLGKVVAPDEHLKAALTRVDSVVES
ncbi:Hypothetical predicted protein, partial [Paramuricea clavata]